MNLRSTLRFLGRLLVVLAATELIPVICCLWYGESQTAWAFITTAALTAVIGGILILIGRNGAELYRREGIIIVVGGWVLASFFGALPYLFSGVISHPVDALFESASGFTTTGASILTDIESAGRGILFWRCFTQWLGGMGIIVLFVALIPELGAGARFLYKLEVPGPTAETLRPRVHETAAALWRIYLLMSGVLAILLLLAGLDFFDALTHTFATMSTGGFSPRNASIAAFDSPLVDGIIILFMLMAGVNFSIYYGLWHKRGRKIFRDPELQTYLGIVAAVSVLITYSLISQGTYENISEAFLDSMFQVVSILTTTGFATADFEAWPNSSRGLMVSLMFIGGCAGSTAGGLKVMRLVIGLKASLREVRLIFSPSHVMSIFIGGKAVPNSVARSVTGFFILYFLSWGVGTLLLAVGNLDLESASTAAIATLGNIGPGLNAVGPTANFSFFAPWQKLVMILLMWLGRLEVYAIAAVATAAFWRR